MKRRERTPRRAAMMERLGGRRRRRRRLARGSGRDDLDEQLRKYLAKAHAIEEQGSLLLERGPNSRAATTLANIYADHLERDARPAEAIEGGSTSWRRPATLDARSGRGAASRAPRNHVTGQNVATIVPVPGWPGFGP